MSVAINDPNANGSGPGSGTGSGQGTEERPPGLDAPPHAQDEQVSGAAAADPGRGGCLKLGWGCLPVLALAAFLPAGLLF
jgi:hypothetical protein